MHKLNVQNFNRSWAPKGSETLIPFFTLAAPPLSHWEVIPQGGLAEVLYLFPFSAPLPGKRLLITSYTLPSTVKWQPLSEWFIWEPPWSGFPASVMTWNFEELSSFSINFKLYLYHLPPFTMLNSEIWSYQCKVFSGFFDHSSCQLYQGKLCWRPDHTMKYPAPFWREKWYYSHGIIPSVFAYPSNAQEVHRALLFFYFS